MMPERKLSEHVVAEPTPAEMRRQWEAIAPRLRRGPPRRRPLVRLLAGSGLATVALLALVLGARTRTPREFASQTEPASLTLGDGSRIELRPSSDVRVLVERPREVRLQVVRGGARFDVRPDPGRRFQVLAAAVEVVVIGTAFTVDLADGRGAPRVTVERGVVEVHGGAPARLLARLRAGEVWPTPAPPPSSSPAAPAAPSATSAPSTGDPSPTAAPARRTSTVDPRQLLEQANAARRSGDVQEAAALLETLRVRYPRDARAALATFELGRIRLDALGDLPGAVAALKQSIALAPTGVFREDAEACLAHAYARMRDQARCGQARQDYLRHYPEGTHHAAVAALDCSAR
jgi:TolA-binding protein